VVGYNKGKLVTEKIRERYGQEMEIVGPGAQMASATSPDTKTEIGGGKEGGSIRVDSSFE